MAYYYRIPQNEIEDLSTPKSIKEFKGKKSPTEPLVKFDFAKHVLIELLDDVTPERELWEALGVAKNKKVVHKRMMTDSHRTNCRRAVVVCTSSDEAKLLAKQLSQATIRNRCICAIVIHELLSDMCLFEKLIRQHGDTRPHHQLLYISDLNQSVSPAKQATFLKEKFHSLGTILSVFVSDKKDGFAAPEGVIKFAFLSEAYAAELAYDQSVLGMQRISVTVNQNILLAQCDLKARLREALFKHANDSFHITANEASVVGLLTNLDNSSCSSFRAAVSSSSSAFEKSTMQQENAPESLKNVTSFFVSSEMNGGSSSKSLHPHSSLGSVRQYSTVSSSADDQVIMEEVPQDGHTPLKSAEVERLSSVSTWSSRVNEWISELPPVEGGLPNTPHFKRELKKVCENDKEQDLITEANPSSPPASVASSFVTCKEMVADFKSISSRHCDITSSNLSFATCKEALNESLSDSNSVNTVWEDYTELDNTLIPLEEEDIDITVPLCQRIRAHSSQKVSPKKNKFKLSEETEDEVFMDVTMPMNGAKEQENNFLYSEELFPKQCIESRSLPVSDSYVISNSMDITVPLKCGVQTKYLKSWADDNTGCSMDMTVPLNGALQTESFKSCSMFNTRDPVGLLESSVPVNNHDTSLNSSISTKGKRDYPLSGKLCLNGEKDNFLETHRFCNPHIATCYLSDLKVVLKIDPVLNAIAKDFSASDPPVIKLDNIGTSENSVQDASMKYRAETVNMVKPKIPTHCESNQDSDSVDVTIPLNSALQARCFKSCSAKKTNDSAYLSKSSVPKYYHHDLTLNSSISSKEEKDSFLNRNLSLEEENVYNFRETRHFCNPHIAACYLSDLRVVLKKDPALDAIAKQFSLSDPPVIKLDSINLSSENSVQDASLGHEEETISMIKQKIPIHCQSNQACDSGHVTIPLNEVLQNMCFKSSIVESTSDSAHFSKSPVPSYDHDSTLNSSISSKRSSSLLSQKLSLKRQKVSYSQENKQLVNPPISTSCLSDLWVVLNTDPELDAIAKQFPVDSPVLKLNASYEKGVRREETGSTGKEKGGKFIILPNSTEQKTTSSDNSSRTGSVLRRSTRLVSRSLKKSLDKSISDGEKDKSQLRIWLKQVLSLSTNNYLFSCQEGTKSIVCATMNKDVLISVGCSHMTCDACYPGSINLLLGYD